MTKSQIRLCARDTPIIPHHIIYSWICSAELYHKIKKTSGHKMGCSLQPKEGQMYSPWRRCTISLKISHPFSTTCDSQSWVILHYCWPAILPSMLTILLSLLLLITESEKHQAIKQKVGILSANEHWIKHCILSAYPHQTVSASALCITIA